MSLLGDGSLIQQVNLKPLAPNARGPRLRLSALDGLRGLAALYVVYFHLSVVLGPSLLAMGKAGKMLRQVTKHGHSAVVLFIVLSGFVLMLPMLQPGRPRPLSDYFRRRARRILPPYFAVLTLALLGGVTWKLFATLSASHLAHLANPFLDGNVTAAGLLSHLVLIHNFRTSWALAVDSPMWSVATEWQIYFIFPLLLLPVWRRLGGVAAVCAGFVCGMIPVMLLPRGTNFDTSCPWFVGTFALGMLAAQTAVSTELSATMKSPRLWAGLVGVLLLVLGVLETRLHARWESTGLWYKDMLEGLLFAVLLVYLARSQAIPSARPMLSRVLESRALVGLGAFSYSLYLIHLPLINLMDTLLPSTLTPTARVVSEFLIGSPLICVCAYLLHLAFERPAALDRWQQVLFGGAPRVAPSSAAPGARSGDSSANEVAAA